jgi:signal transduction histidine kinase
VKNLSLRTKLLLAASAVPAGTLAIVMLLSLITGPLLGGTYSRFADFGIPVTASLEEVKLAGTQIVSSVSEITVNELIGDDGGEVEEVEEEGETAQLRGAINDYQTYIAAAQSLFDQYASDDSATLALLNDVHTKGDVLVGQAGEFITLVEGDAPVNELGEAREAFEDIERSFLTSVDELLAQQNRNFDAIGNSLVQLITITAIVNGLLTVLTIGAAVGVTRFLARTMSRPMRDLNEVTTKLGQGNLDVRATVYSNDELGQVATAFNEMAEAIQKRDLELKDINQSLEKRVAARTVDLKKARDEALALQRIAQENSRLKSEFLSTMSHELRTPLNAIEGFTSIMLGGMGIQLSPKAEDMTRRISSNSKRLLSLINDFLDLSRIESGRLELVQEPLSPSALAQKWENEVGVLADGKGIAFGVDIDPELPNIVYGDEDALSKIAINLLGNAFKFTKAGSVSLVLGRHNKIWTISVSDTGIGIPPHAREYIFDEFRQVDGSSKREYGGTGLGLALVQKLARAMGGSVALESEIGAGSTFTVSLPLVTELEGQEAGVPA